MSTHGNYANAFARQLARQGFEFLSWATQEGELPLSIHSADG